MPPRRFLARHEDLRAQRLGLFHGRGDIVDGDVDLPEGRDLGGKELGGVHDSRIRTLSDEDLTVALRPDGIWGGAAGADLLDARAEDRPVERQRCVVVLTLAFEPVRGTVLSPPFGEAGCVPGCQNPMTAPAGSVTTIIEPRSPTAIGGTMTVAPAASAAATVAWASAVFRYTDQMFAGPSPIGGTIPATRLPLRVKFW